MPSQPPPPSTPPLSTPAPAVPAPVESGQARFRRASWGPADAVLGVIGVIGALIVGGLIIYPITGADGVDATLASQALLELALVGVAFWIARWRGERNPLHALGLRRPRPGWIKVAVAGYAIYFVAVIVIVTLIGEPEQSDVADQLGFETSTFAAIVAGLLIVVVAPVCEEIFFRGFFFAGLRSKLPFWLAGLLSALLFGAVHLSDANVIAAAQLTLLGLVLAGVYERTDSLWSNIAVHAFNNAIAFTLLVTS